MLRGSSLPMATNSQQLGRSGESYIVTSQDPGSAFVKVSDVLSVLESLCVRDSALIRDANLRPDHPVRSERERWEIFSGRVAALRVAADQVRGLPSRPADDLMGEKPILDLLEKARARFRSLSMSFAARANDPMEPRPDFCEDEWNRCDAVAQYLVTFLASFSGSAEEQLEPREESRPPIGAIPVTAAGANPRPPLSICDYSQSALDRASDSFLEDVSDAVLEELERRGIAARWQPAVA